MLASLHRTLALLVLGLMLTACGRSSLLGSSPEDCPPSQLRTNGTCDRSDGGIDGGTDGFTACSSCSTTGCDQPGCCACEACSGALFCQNVDGGTDGGDGFVNPCQTKADCVKLECLGNVLCHVLGTEICNNGIDDDDNGLIDCADPACFTFPGCQVKTCPTPVDCTLPICTSDPACQNLQCMPTVDFGTLQITNSSSTKTVDTTGTKDVTVTPCAPGGGGEVVGEFTLAGTAMQSADVALAFMQAMGEDHVFGLFRAGVNQTCGANPVECYDPKGATMGTHAFQALAPGNYYVIAQAFEPAGQGKVTVTLSTPTSAEICDNGIDDNGNGLIDCQEASCANAPNCLKSECDVDINLGALVVNGPAKDAMFDTTGASANNTLTCEGAPGAGDVVVRFTLQQTAGILVNWSQTGDHVMALVRLPDPGEPCDTNQISCYDPSGRPMDSVAFDYQPPGDYALIWKGLQPGDDGMVSAQISAYVNRQMELCHNGIDDDGNGLIDCADPACIGVSGCSAPYCEPNKSVTLNVGESTSVTLDVATDGEAGYVASCAMGGGKGEVIQVTIGGTTGVAIGFNCTQTGDQVISLYQAGGPRDKCDYEELVCADPKTLPFGCGYAVPNLDPGTYNVIVEGYQAGSEGTMNLTLSVSDDRVLEICNNGIDDDNNGLIDCADPKCATNPDCAKVACHADATIDPVPLTGTQTFRLVQTAGNGSQANVPCATAPGGQTAVIELDLTAEADLTLQWNQLGNHDFALYTDSGASLPCSAGTVLSCQKSADAANGSITFPAVPEGKVYLVVAGDAPDTMTSQSSGSVSIAISGLPTP